MVDINNSKANLGKLAAIIFLPFVAPTGVRCLSSLCEVPVAERTFRDLLPKTKKDVAICAGWAVQLAGWYYAMQSGSELAAIPLVTNMISIGYEDFKENMGYRLGK